MYGWLSIGILILKKNWKSYGKRFIDQKEQCGIQTFGILKYLLNTVYKCTSQ